METLQAVRSSSKTALFVVTLALFVDMMIYGLAVPVLPLYASSLGIAPSGIGLLFGSYAIALLLSTPLWGVLSDHIGRRNPMLLGLLGLFAATLLFAFAQSYTMLVVARVFQGISAAATWTAGLALLADVFPSESRGKAMGIALVGNGIGILIGPFLGGVLYGIGGYHMPFLVAVGLVVIDGVACLWLLNDVAHEKSQPLHLSAFLRQHNILIIGSVVVLGAAIPAFLEPVLPLYQRNQFGATPTIIGLLFLVLTISSAFSMPIAGGLSDKLGRVPLMVLGLLLTALALPLVTLAPSLLLEGGALVLLGLAQGLAIAPTMPALADEVDHFGGGAYGGVYAIYNTAYAFGLMGGPLTSGFLTGAFGIQFALVCGGLFVLVFSPLLLIGLRRGK